MTDLNSPKLIHHEESKDIFIVDCIDEAHMDVDRALSRNGVVNDSTLQVDVDKASSFVGVLLHMQRDLYEQISRSVDADLHKYLEISQTFSESKNLLGDSAAHIRHLVAYVEGQIEASSRQFGQAFSRENRLKDLLIQLKQATLLERISSFLEKSPEKSLFLSSYANELSYISKSLTTEKCLQSFKIQQLFEHHSVTLAIKERHAKFIRLISERLTNAYQPTTDAMDRLATVEDVFLSFNLLGNKPKFEELLSSDLLRRVAKATLNQTNFAATVLSLKTLLQEDLAWLVEMSEHTGEEELKHCIWDTLAGILLKGVFSKSECFPVSDLEAYAENYQLYYLFTTDLFKTTGIPSAVRTHMKKKESLLYKSYVMHVIKKLEGSLIQLTNFINTCKTGPEIEEYCYKKCGKTLKAILQDLVLKNVSKDTMTTSLLHRVFAIGLRTIIRIKAFFTQFYETLTEPSILSHLARTNIDLSLGLLSSLPENIQEIASKLSLDPKQRSPVESMFSERVRDLLHCGLGQQFANQTSGSLHLEDDVAGIALKLSMQLEMPQTESVIVNNARIAVDKFVTGDGLPQVLERDKKVAACRYLLECVQNHYNKQIEDSINTMAANQKYNQPGDDKGHRLDLLIEKQKQLDVAALNNLIL